MQQFDTRLERIARIKLEPLVALAVALCLHSPHAHAHHSFAAVFTTQRPIVMTGTVTEVEWANPHCHVQVMVKNVDGSQEPWTFEFGAPMALHKAGMQRDMLPAGQIVTITGYAAKDDSKLGWVSKFAFPDGRVIRITPDSGSGAPPPA